MNTHTPSRERRYDIVVAFLLFLVCILISIFATNPGFDFISVAGLN